MNATKSERYLQGAGTFTCKVEKPAHGWLAEIGEKNTPCVQVPLMVCEGPMTGKRITYYGWLTPNAYERTMTTLHECFQFNGDFVTLAEDPNGFTDLKCRVTTTMERYRGQVRCGVKRLSAMDQGAG